MINANSINEVITNLDIVIEWSKKQQSRIGYFAVLYRSMTIAVQQGILNNNFEDGGTNGTDGCYFCQPLFAGMGCLH